MRKSRQFAARSTNLGDQEPRTRSHPHPSGIGRSSNGRRIRRLIGDAERAYRNDPNEAFRLGSEAFELACAAGDQLLKGESLLEMSAASHVLSHYEKAIQFSREALDIFQKLRNSNGEGDAMHKLAALEFELGNVPKALALAHEALAIREQAADAVRIADTLVVLAWIYERLGNYSSALQHSLRSLDHAERAGNKRRMAVALTSVARIYTIIGMPEAALEYHAKGRITSADSVDKAGEAGALYNMACIYDGLGNRELANNYLSQALAAYEMLGESLGIARVLLHIARLELGEGNLVEALNHYGRSLQLARRIQHKATIVDSLAGIAEAEVAVRRGRESMPLLHEALATAEEIGYVRGKVAVLRLLSDLEEAEGNLGRALELERAYVQSRIVLVREENDQQVKAYEARLQIERSARESERLRLEAETLKREAAEREHELDSAAIKLLERERFLKSLRQSLRSEAVRAASGFSRTLLREVERELNLGGESEEFALKLEDTKREFLGRLAQRHPLLTPSELRIAALLQLGYSSKKIAAILHCSPRTVETHRKSVRRKVNLGLRANLVTYLASI